MAMGDEKHGLTGEGEERSCCVSIQCRGGLARVAFWQKGKIFLSAGGTCERGFGRGTGGAIRSV
jgi:hypothetical protein